ncbi:MAG TPA: hypothetical protein VLE24_02905, partial [Methyloceanibacter sp.]|nr:hypothetical protein [Methyloceanibacter sp.]
FHIEDRPTFCQLDLPAQVMCEIAGQSGHALPSASTDREGWTWLEADRLVGQLLGALELGMEAPGKRLELLRDLIPGLRRLAIMANVES